MNLPSCVVCDRPCIPMADYDETTCIACDQVMEVVSLVAPAIRRQQQVAGCGSHTAYNRHVRRGEEVDDLCRAAQRRYQRDRMRAYRAAAATSNRQPRAIHQHVDD